MGYINILICVLMSYFVNSDHFHDDWLDTLVNYVCDCFSGQVYSTSFLVSTPPSIRRAEIALFSPLLQREEIAAMTDTGKLSLLLPVCKRLVRVVSMEHSTALLQAVLSRLICFHTPSTSYALLRAVLHEVLPKHEAAAGS